MATAITEEARARLAERQPLWHRSAPRRLVENCRRGDPTSGWSVWRKYLANRKHPVVPPHISGKRPPLLWAWPSAWDRSQLATVLRSLGDTNAVSGERIDRLPAALQAVAAAYALPQLSSKLPPESWWRLAESLRAVAIEASAHRVDWPTDPGDVLRNQLLGGELPLALSYLFPELYSYRELRSAARDVLTDALVELTDGKGLPHASLLPVLGPLFATWTRSRWLGSRIKQGCWSSAADTQYKWLVRQSIRLTDGQGGLMLSENSPADTLDLSPLFAMALSLVDDKTGFAIGAERLPSKSFGTRATRSKEKLPKPSYSSEWSGVAILARDWKKSSPRLAVTYADEQMRLEFRVDRQRLLAGTINSQTSCDGKSLHPVGSWEELCWHVDKDCAYLELGIDLSDGLRLERQIVLPRTNDQVMYIADAVSSNDSSPRRLQHSLRLPIGPNTMWQPEADTRDGALIGKKLRAAVLPLALGEWRTDPRSGNLCEEAGRLTLTQEWTGRALYCPLLIDFDTRRTKRERTWRQLTVAESLTIVPRDVAVAFRAQSGQDQWLVYRSLGRSGNRTFMGQNISGEFCAGRFPKSGEMDEWIEVEAF